MLYCAKCGNPVIEGAKFCEKCFSRLEVSGTFSAVDKYAIAASKKDENEFNPDSYVLRSDLIGERILGYRITEEIGSSGSSDYYYASSGENGVTEKRTIQHIIMPDRISSEALLSINGFSGERARAAVEKCAGSIKDEVGEYRKICEKAGIHCIYEDCAVCYSEASDVYHIFILMDPVIPLKEYLQTHEVRLRDVVMWGIKLTGYLSAIASVGGTHDDVDDSNVYFDANGEIWPGGRIRSILSENMYFSAYSVISNIYEKPMSRRGSSCVYSVGMLLYLMLNEFRHPYLNRYDSFVDGSKFLDAEKRRAEHTGGQTPYYAQNSLGNTLLRTFADIDGFIPTIGELGSILQNSLNYISADELDTVVLKIGSGKAAV